MNTDDLLYLRLRVEEELDLAQTTQDPLEAQAHYLLAALYMNRTGAAEAGRDLRCGA